MRALLRISLFAATALSPVYGQSAPTPLPPAMQSAIDRLLKVAPQQGVPGRVELGRLSPAPAGLCSVPLLEMHVDHPERFILRTVPPPAINDAMPRAHGPAPPCDQPASSAPPAPRP